MKLENLKKIKKELEKEKQQNYTKIKLFDEKARLSKINTFEYKMVNIFGLSMIGYLFISPISLAVIKNLGVISFTNVISALSYPVIIMSSSLGVGTLINILLNKKFHTKERIKAFSNAKNQMEKSKEEIYYQIELENANNKNLVINQAISIANYNEDILKKIPNEYELIDKKNSKNEEDIKKRIEELETVIKKQNNKLETLSTQKVLHDRFWRIRSKTQRRIDIFISAILIGLFITLFTEFPLLLINESITYSSVTTGIVATFTPLVSGVIATCGYMIKRNKDQNKIFNHFNYQLGENALPEKYKTYNEAYEEQEKIKSLIETQIRNLSLTIINLKQEQQMFNNIISTENLQTSVKNKFKSKDQKNNLHSNLSQIETQNHNLSQEKALSLTRKRKYTNPANKE